MQYLQKNMGLKLIFCLQIKTKVFCKLIVSLWVWVARHAQSTQNNKFTISLQYPREDVKDEVDFLPADKRQRFLQIDTIILGVCVWSDMPKLSKTTSLLFPWNISRKKWMMKLIICMQISMKACCKLIQWFWQGWSSIRKVVKIASLERLYNISKKKLGMEFIFCLQIKFLQVDFIVLNESDQTSSKYPKYEVGNLFAIY